jgi:Fe-S-cluster-containing dehydrogenase component
MPSVNELPAKTRVHDASPVVAPLNRRHALGLLAGGIATSLAACSKPAEPIIPYVRMPERLAPGEPMRFATALSLSGYGRGVMVTSIDGRPIKVEGNSHHPASLGATDVFAEAAVLSLYDPDRSRVILNDGAIVSRDAFLLALQGQLAQIRQQNGGRLRLLTGRITSPTLLRQIDQLLDTFKEARWHAYDAIDDANALAGATAAFGTPFRVFPRLQDARVLVTLDADPIGHGPEQLRNARGFAARRRVGLDTISRLYCIEAAPTLTGAKADHRLALPPHLLVEAAIALANSAGAGLREASLPENAMRFVKQSAADLLANHGQALLLAGPSLPPEAHALVHWVNVTLQAPRDLVEPLDRTPNGRTPSSLSDLAHDLDAGDADQLLIIGANPAYDAPVDLGFAARMSKAAFRLHLGGYVDETATIANWHVPMAHDLESWSDLRAVDGTASIVQPLVRPLYNGWTAHQLLAALAGQADASSYSLVRETWRRRATEDFEAWWARALTDGIIAGTALQPSAPGQPKLPVIGEPPAVAAGLAIVLKTDPSVWDGSFANNAWLQECPKPLTKQVWGHALGLNQNEAARLGVTDGDVVAIMVQGRRIEISVMIVPGTADGVGSLTLGYGRSKAGAIGNNIGSNACVLQTAEHRWVIPEVTIEKTGRREVLLTTQNVVRTAEDVRELYPLHKVGQAEHSESGEDFPSLLPNTEPQPDSHAWAMVIDTAVCIGCNACVVACQAENNVPVVGPDEIARGRDMHWLRVDVYDHGTPANPALGFQPVPCMHCEHAPCEPVCPVAASVHDHEGLNVQVYNRCIGTRFCEANCPYKVRRFNFFGYADGQEYANLGFDSYRGQKNSDVTVRARGVMEKCTYCVQRISRARRLAERDDREIGADEVRTACQSACPTQAISFGDMNNAASAVSQQKTDARHYALLGHLGTRPRTSYLADIRNPASGLDGDAT